MKIKINKLFVNLSFILSSFVTFAQPGDTDGTPTDNLEGTDPAASINSLLLVLFVSGFIFALYSLNKNKKIA
jgi:hypothetical protein